MTHTKFLTRLTLAACALSGLCAAPIRADSLWLGNDTLFRLQASGSGRSLIVERPSAEAAAQGVTAGTVVFQGKRDGAVYRGTFTDPSAGCEGGGVAVSGKVLSETNVLLAPQAAMGCKGLLGDGLNLRFVDQASAAKPAPEPEAEPAEEAEAAAPVVEEAEPAEAAETSVAMADETAVAEAAEPVAETVAEPAAEPAPVAEAEAEAAAPAAVEVAEAETEVAEPVAATTAQPWQVPAAACVPKAAAQGISIAGCQGMLAGLRLAQGADPAAEADRRALMDVARGATDLNRAVDTACYDGARIGDHDAGLALVQTNRSLAEGLRPLCLEMIAAANKVPAAARLATVATAAGAIGGEVWTLKRNAGSCKGQEVLRVTELGLFQGRYGSESTVTNATVSDWSDDGARLSARITIHSEILTAPDVILQIAAERGDDGLRLTIDRQRVTPQSRYSNAPEYESDRIAGTYYACDR